LREAPEDDDVSVPVLAQAPSSSEAAAKVEIASAWIRMRKVSWCSVPGRAPDGTRPRDVRELGRQPPGGVVPLPEPLVLPAVPEFGGVEPDGEVAGGVPIVSPDVPVPVVPEPAAPVLPAMPLVSPVPELPIVPLPASVVAPVPGASAVLTPESLPAAPELPASFRSPPHAPSASDVAIAAVRIQCLLIMATSM
jgi:hypothetical protein